MKLFLLLAGLCAMSLSIVSYSPAQAAPALQLPWPVGVQHRISGGNTYGCGTHTNSTRNSYAIDFQTLTSANPSGIGELVNAVAGGTIVDGRNDWSSSSSDDRGNFIDIDHGGGYRTRYLHLRLGTPWAPGIGIGVYVTQGQHIGYSGNTAFVAAHLHFDMQLYDAQGNSSAYKAEPLSNITGFGGFGFSNEDGSCDDDGVSPYWSSMPPVSIMAANWGSADGNDDFAVWRPGNGVWYKRGVGQVQFGVFGDIPAPGYYSGYYSGSNTAHPAVYRPCDSPCSALLGRWLVEDVCIPGTQCADYNVNGTLDSNLQWGVRGDIPVPGDYNGGGWTDFAVWRPDNAVWYIRHWGGFTPPAVQFGLPGDIPVPGDYNGDGSTDIAVWRPCEVCVSPFLSYWYIENVALPGEAQGDFNGNGTTDTKIQWGVRGDIPAQGDYYGDVKTNFAVWRPGAQPLPVWYVRGLPALQWGLPGDIPVPGDYDSLWADETVWRPCGVCGPSSLAYWFVEHATIPGATYGDYNWNGSTDSQVQWGFSGDIPLAGRQGR